jgi:hypothetical protein
MKYKIDPDILNQTTECLNYFSCLFGKKDCLCEVSKSIKSGGGMFFIEPLKKDACTYKMPLEFSWLCSCPTRIAIYKKYGE